MENNKGILLICTSAIITAIDLISILFYSFIPDNGIINEISFYWSILLVVILVPLGLYLMLPKNKISYLILLPGLVHLAVTILRWITFNGSSDITLAIDYYFYISQILIGIYLIILSYVGIYLYLKNKQINTELIGKIINTGLISFAVVLPFAIIMSLRLDFASPILESLIGIVGKLSLQFFFLSLVFTIPYISYLLIKNMTAKSAK